jgi:diguanylate cyclase (GGDEF)-like protein/PAS domain S-box-containing protein
MANLASNPILSVRGSFRPESTPSHRRRPVSVLFVHRDADAIDSCLQELEKGQFAVQSDLVLNLAQCAAQLRTRSYDVVIVEYPSPSFKGSQALQLLRQTAQEIPLIFLTFGIAIESIVELAAQGAFEYVELEHIAQLPMAVRRALNEKKLRAELQEAEKALRHSQSLYRALVDNPSYGICRSEAGGKLLDVNQALLTMLGYESKEELLAANRASEIVLDLGERKPLAGSFPEAPRAEPIEREWKRKNGTILKVSLSGRDAFDEHGNFNGCEIIVVDVTEQRTLEEQLRIQASSDSLTGLANHRRLFEVLQAEVCRSKRTGRDFSLVLLDLDGLKQINDQYSHLAGDRALCRLGQILKDSCRSVDTAARHGGDEFAVVLPETSIAAAALVGRRICELLEKETEEPVLSVSVGIASYPKDADTIGTLLYVADKSLYAMKSSKPQSLLRASAMLGH